MFQPQSQWRSIVALLPIVAMLGVAAATAGPRASSASTASLRISDPISVPAGSPASADDPVVALMASSDRHFKAGQTALEQGHFEAAKHEFNQAIAVLLESSYGARTEPRIREQFDRLVDRISTYEM